MTQPLNPQHPFDRGWVDSRAGLKAVAKRKNPLPLPETEPQSSSP